MSPSGQLEVQKKTFFLEQSGGSLEHGTWRDKKIENSEQFQKCIQKAQRGHGGKRLGWHRDGDQPVAGPHPDPDTSYETLHGSLDVNLQVYPSK
jgi:hypothetical protein